MNCDWPKFKCFQDTLSESEKFCYWHRKVLLGLVDSKSSVGWELEELRHKEGYAQVD